MLPFRAAVRRSVAGQPAHSVPRRQTSLLLLVATPAAGISVNIFVIIVHARLPLKPP